MSSLFVEAEVALAELGLDRLAGRTGLDVVVGGLGLGYTARAVLDTSRCRRARRRRCARAGDRLASARARAARPGLVGDPRCRLVQGDFFALAAAGAGFDPSRAGLGPAMPFSSTSTTRRDTCSPRRTPPFYTADGLRRVAGALRAGGVFALWSNDPPDEVFLATMAEVFTDPRRAAWSPSTTRCRVGRRPIPSMSAAPENEHPPEDVRHPVRGARGRGSRPTRRRRRAASRPPRAGR